MFGCHGPLILMPAFAPAKSSATAYISINQPPARKDDLHNPQKIRVINGRYDGFHLHTKLLLMMHTYRCFNISNRLEWGLVFKKSCSKWGLQALDIALS